MRISRKDAAAFFRRSGGDGPPPVAPKATEPVQDAMNKTERRYAQRLEALRLAGEIVRWDYEPERFRLADNTFYCPDFRVIRANGTVEFHEVKGAYVREDAWLKFKLAAELHPYVFVLAKEIKRQWQITRYQGGNHDS